MCVFVGGGGGDQLFIWKIPLLTMFLSSDRILPFLLRAGICGKLGNLAGTNIRIMCLYVVCLTQCSTARIIYCTSSY